MNEQEKTKTDMKRQEWTEKDKNGQEKRSIYKKMEVMRKDENEQIQARGQEQTGKLIRMNEKRQELRMKNKRIKQARQLNMTKTDRKEPEQTRKN